MSEKALWTAVRNGMKGNWDACRLENNPDEGVPDVSYGLRGVNGFIELKHMPAWPKRATTIVKIDHFTQAQRKFLTTRGAAGGHCFLLLQVARDYLLFDHNQLKLINLATQREMKRGCMKHWKGSIQWREFADILSYKEDDPNDIYYRKTLGLRA